MSTEEEIKEPFDFKKANELLDQGYVIRHKYWDDEEYYQKSEGVIYDEEGEEALFELTPEDDPKEENFELFYETEEECEPEKTGESTTQDDGALQSKSNEEESTIESESKKKDTQTIEELNSESITNETKMPLENVESETTNSTKNIELNNENNGQETIETNKMKLSESTTPETELINSEKSLRTENEEILSSDSSQQLDSVSLVQSQSMNLIDSSANHLYSLMKSVTPNPDKENYTTPAVDVSVRIAKELREIMKLKLETLKFAKEIMR